MAKFKFTEKGFKELSIILGSRERLTEVIDDLHDLHKLKSAPIKGGVNHDLIEAFNSYLEKTGFPKMTHTLLDALEESVNRMRREKLDFGLANLRKDILDDYIHDYFNILNVGTTPSNDILNHEDFIEVLDRGWVAVNIDYRKIFLDDEDRVGLIPIIEIHLKTLVSQGSEEKADISSANLFNLAHYLMGNGFELGSELDEALLSIEKSYEQLTIVLNKIAGKS